MSSHLFHLPPSTAGELIALAQESVSPAISRGDWAQHFADLMTKAESLPEDQRSHFEGALGDVLGQAVFEGA